MFKVVDPKGHVVGEGCVFTDGSCAFHDFRFGGAVPANTRTALLNFLGCMEDSKGLVIMPVGDEHEVREVVSPGGD